MAANSRMLAALLAGEPNPEANAWLDAINTPQGGPSAPQPPAIMFYTPQGLPMMGAGPRGFPAITGRTLTPPDYSPEAAIPQLPMQRDVWGN